MKKGFREKGYTVEKKVLGGGVEDVVFCKV